MISDVEFAKMNWLQRLLYMSGVRTLWRNRPVLVSQTELQHLLEENSRAENYQRLMWMARNDKSHAMTQIVDISERPDCPLEIRRALEGVAEQMGWIDPEGFVPSDDVE